MAVCGWHYYGRMRAAPLLSKVLDVVVGQAGYVPSPGRGGPGWLCSKSWTWWARLATLKVLDVVGQAGYVAMHVV